MGRHSRKGPEAKSQGSANAEGDPGTGPSRAAPAGAAPAGAGNGRRRRSGATPSGDGDGHTPFHGVPQVRGGHPEQREAGGGWGTGPQQRYGDRPTGPSPAGFAGAARGGPPRRMPLQAPQVPQVFDTGQTPAQQASAQQAAARQVSAQQAALRAADRRTGLRPGVTEGPALPGPRKEFVDAFDGARPAAESSADPYESVTRWSEEQPFESDTDDTAERAASGKGGKGRTLTGIAAAAVTTVLAVVVAGQVAQDPDADRDVASQGAGVDREGGKDASRSDARPTPQPKVARVKPLTYAQKMAKPYPLAPDLTAAGTFEAVPGLAQAPGKARKFRYRIDVEKGLALDSGLFADAVQKTLNDDRSWAHNGAMTFERISSGEADFVITLASPGTTGVWCAKSGLDTTQDNVSCDSAATDRIMINAYRWAQGSSTFGPEKLMDYRQMLINHEVGHRLGYGHVNCETPGALAPVMQQQTKSLNIGGVKCRPNAWVYPGN
ncbi:DUF3152 domain-containing protein [Streptomyces finlayi]|uniref:DUF3152 domain-containing protein n=1 Tax=Streptomyces finlayi TaxID=67296 RepID=A0A7G7BIC9_9ACTN|nr:DUF3152 domain-containing protein [Streptomyces finlayi]QNE75094.1 DUF3152 domain-containing protein [Streptomyces finlayi]